MKRRPSVSRDGLCSARALTGSANDGGQAASPLTRRSRMKVGILGSGDVAKTLAGGFLQHGNEVMLGTRTPAKLAAWATAHPQARIASVTEAAGFGELVVLAVKGTAAADVLWAAGAATLAGKP